MSRIAAVAVTPYALRLVRPWRTAAGTVTRRHGWLVRVSDRDGAIGLGDCPAGLPDQTEDGSGRRLETLGRTILGLEPGVALADHRDRSRAGAALDCALRDLCARRAGLSLARALSADAADHVRVNAVAEPDRIAAAVEAGFSVVKIKVGLGCWRDEAAALTRLVLPAGLWLRLDANRAWSRSEAEAFLAAVASLPIEAVEEPLRHPDLDALAALQAGTMIALAIDESLDVLGIEALCDRRPVRRLVLKPALCGGPGPALALANRAAAAELEVVVTTFLDSAVGGRMAAHLAAAVDPAGRLAHGLSTAAWLAEDVALPLPVDAGRLALGSGSGLGLPVGGLAVRFDGLSDPGRSYTGQR